MAGAGYYLWLDVQSQEVTESETTQNEIIGYIEEQTSNVKRKLGDSLYWNPVKTKEALFANDSIRTGAESQAVIQLNDKSQIELAENSLIVLEKTANNLNVDFKTGDIETKSGDQNLTIKVKDTVLDSKSAELKLSTDSKNNTQIIVTKGTATLTDKNKQKVELATKKVVSVDEKGQAKQIAVALVLNTPKDKVIILDPEKMAQVPFTWTVLDDEQKEEFFELSSKPDFSIKLFEKKGHQAVQAPVPRGVNYWRVGWKNKDGKISYSEVRSLKLEEDKRLLNSSPANNATLDFEPEQDKVTFAWAAIGEPKSFLLEIAKDDKFSTLFQSQTTTSKSLEISGVRDGKYFWRVRAFGDNNNEIGRTAPWFFTVRKTLPQLPLLIFPDNGFVWTLNDPLSFEWKPLEKVVQYRWTVTKDPLQTNIIKQETLASNKFLWKWSQPGDYYWNVNGLNEKGEVVSRSVMHKLKINPTVSGPAIILQTPPNQSTVKRDRREPMDPVIFEWTVERPIASGPFTLYISEKPDFSESLKKTGIESTKVAIRLNKSANYYWKVEWIGSQKTKNIPTPTTTSTFTSTTNSTSSSLINTSSSTISSTSTSLNSTSTTLEYESLSKSQIVDREVSIPFVFKYRVSSNLLAPNLIEPLDNAKRVTPKKEKVEFRWTKVQGAIQYRITLEREHPQTKERIPVTSQIVTKESFISAPLEPGNYFWFVTSLDQEKVEGPPGQVRSLIIELNKELSAPKLKAPVIK